ncbi:hypothetical protein N9W34_03340 [Rickettsiales bacterium]|nr:hypothetical protein [Rickettsiales bacterium]
MQGKSLFLGVYLASFAFMGTSFAFDGKGKVYAYESKDLLKKSGFVAIGYNDTKNQYLKKARFEAKLSYDDISDYQGAEKVSSMTLMANSYYDFESQKNFVPYLGFGVGAIEYNYESGYNSQADKQIVPAYNFLAGIAYEPVRNSGVEFNLGYSCLKSINTNSNIVIGSDDFKRMANKVRHAIKGKLRIKF